ncbi:MAG: Fe-Mn family superoxide dismutase [Candidatus Algichlamydia australiensis]|nr:Fe-Mn family superoxide dismutase [Chlamydiales bacterium]
MAKYTLPDLPYDYSALEPVIAGEIMELHHSKHHNGYVTKLNEATEKYAEAEAKGDVAVMCATLQAIKFNGGGHINHSIFWTNLAPQSAGGGEPPKGALAEAINKEFGSLEQFIEKFNAKTGPIQGSGWGWLGFCPEKKSLCIAACANQDPLVTAGLVPLLGIDVWEHAYYLQYKNARPEYLKNIWKVVNWQNVAERYEKVIQ